MTSYETRNAALLEAHASKDTNALINIYRQEGEAALALGDIHRGCFFLTHAYIYALEAGAGEASEIHEILVSHGREE